MSDVLEDEDDLSSVHHSSEEYSCGYEGAEWLEHVASDGSLLYVESYVSSAVREKQVLALKTSREKKNNLDEKTQAQSSSNSGKIKKENKLLSLLRRRPSIRGKSSDKLSLSLAVSLSTTGEERNSCVGGGSTKTGSTASKRIIGDSSKKDSVVTEGTDQGNKPRDISPAPKVTFRDNKSGEMRTVALHVVSVGDGRGGLCEAVLGVVAGRFSEPPTHRIMVAGILPGSEAHTTHAIKIGDWLKEINRRDVSWSNIDEVLGEIRVPSVVTLGLQQCASETLTDQDHSNRKRITQTLLVRHVTGRSVQEYVPIAADSSQPYDLVRGAPPHVALLLTLRGVTDTSPEGSDIKYQFPHGSSRLVRVRGVFLTLAHALHDLTATDPSSSSVQLSSGEVVHVAYRREGHLVWVMALPRAYCSERELVCLSELITANLCFEFGSLAQSVGDPSRQAYCDHLLGKVFCSVVRAPQHRQLLHHSLRSPTTLPMAHYLYPDHYLPCGGRKLVLHEDGSPAEEECGGSGSGWCGVWGVLGGAVPWLVLQDGGGAAKTALDNCLSELEAADFGEEEDDDCDQCDGMDHNIEGCALFYKGVLTCSHLSPPLLLLVHRHARLHGLLQLTAAEAVSGLVSWRRVHVSGGDGNTGLLMVAMNHLLLAMIVEENPLPQSTWCGVRGGPDPFLVQQVEATLYHLHSMHIPALCQDSLSRGGPEVISPDDLSRDSVPTARRDHDAAAVDKGVPPSVPMPDVPSILKQRPSPRPMADTAGDDVYCTPPLGTLVGEEGDDEEEEGEDSSQGDGDVWTGALSSPVRGSDGDPAPLSRLPVTAIRVTTGPTPALFHLVHLDVGEGVLIESLPASDPDGLTSDSSTLNPALLASFRAACVYIHGLLHSRLFMQLGDCYGDGAREHGLLLSCAPPASATVAKKKAAPPLNYWVVGRVVPPSSREVYVCYHESAPQNLHEIAARLCLGATL